MIYVQLKTLFSKIGNWFNLKPKNNQNRIKYYRERLSERSCYDCISLRCEVSWWCVNKKACKHRGTHVPDIKHCPYYRPNKKRIREDYFLN